MQSILSAPKWAFKAHESDEDDRDTRMSPTSSDSGRSPQPARKLVKAGAKSSSAATRDQKPGDPRKQQAKERPLKAGRAGEQQGQSNAGKGPDAKPKSSTAQAKPKHSAPQGAAAAGKPGLEGGQGRSAAARPDPARIAGTQGAAATHKRSPLGPQGPTKAAAVWAGEPATSLSHKPGAGPKFAAKQGLGPAAGVPSTAAASNAAKKLPVKEHRHLGVGNGSNSNNSSGADANTAGGPLILQPSDIFMAD